MPQRIKTIKRIHIGHQSRPNETGKTPINLFRFSHQLLIKSSKKLQAAELSRLNREHADHLEKHVDELQRLNGKLNDASLANKQLNDELNEKTEQICHLHKENSRYAFEIQYHSNVQSKMLKAI